MNLHTVSGACSTGREMGTPSPLRALVLALALLAWPTGTAEPTAVAEGLARLEHPRFVLRHADADRHSFEHWFGGAAMRHSRRLVPRVKARLRRLLA